MKYLPDSPHLVSLTPQTAFSHIKAGSSAVANLRHGLQAVAISRGIKETPRLQKFTDECLLAIAEVADGFGADNEE